MRKTVSTEKHEKIHMYNLKRPMKKTYTFEDFLWDFQSSPKLINFIVESEIIMNLLHKNLRNLPIDSKLSQTQDVFKEVRLIP